MFFSIITNLRKVFFGATMLGFIIWHSEKLSPAVSAIINYAVPIAALLAVINEIAYVVYLHFFFESVKANIVPKEDTQEHNVVVKNYDLVFEFEGMSYSLPHRDSVFGRSITDSPFCQILVHKRPPRLAFIDTFSQRYLYLIVSLFLLWSVYSVYTTGI